MIRQTIYSAAVCALVAVGLAGGSVHTARHTAGVADPRIPLYYRCPMHPTYTSDKPGTAPCCGMKLEPVFADTTFAGTTDRRRNGAASVLVSEQQQQLIGVKVAQVESRDGTERVRLFGRVLADETRVRKLTVGVNGYVRETYRATTGSYVRRGELLATFSTVEMRQSIAAYISALDVAEREQKSSSSTPAQIAATAGGVEATYERLLSLGMSTQQIDEVKATRLVPNQIQVASPIDGIVLARNVVAGQKIDMSSELYQIADLRRVWILADLPSGGARSISPGAVGRVRAPGSPDPLPARASASAVAQFDPATQSMKVRLEADNPGFVLRPDMFVDVEMDLPYPAALTVPEEAVLATGLRNTVFVERSAGVFEPREVKTGRRVDGRIQILGGLVPGERLAVSGTFLLDAESRMRAK